MANVVRVGHRLCLRSIWMRRGTLAKRSVHCRWTSTTSTTPPPAPGSPFHLAIPVHNLAEASHFYGEVLGCRPGRFHTGKWIDYSLQGHQLVLHWVGEDYRCHDYYNPVDGDEVPVPHFGLQMEFTKWRALASRLEAADVDFIIEPTLRFKGMPGEQHTFFLKDVSGNNLEFKSMSVPDNLFARYEVRSEP